jgi:hypothetical protein
LQVGAEQLAGVRIDLFDLHPLRDTSLGRRGLAIWILRRRGRIVATVTVTLVIMVIIIVYGVIVAVVVAIVAGGIVGVVVEGEPAKQQVGQQIGAHAPPDQSPEPAQHQHRRAETPPRP